MALLKLCTPGACAAYPRNTGAAQHTKPSQHNHYGNRAGQEATRLFSCHGKALDKTQHLSMNKTTTKPLKPGTGNILDVTNNICEKRAAHVRLGGKSGSLPLRCGFPVPSRTPSWSSGRSHNTGSWRGRSKTASPAHDPIPCTELPAGGQGVAGLYPPTLQVPGCPRRTGPAPGALPLRPGATLPEPQGNRRAPGTRTSGMYHPLLLRTF